jgi:hypothetical protein
MLIESVETIAGGGANRRILSVAQTSKAHSRIGPMRPGFPEAQLRQAAFDHVNRLTALKGGTLDSAG